MAYRQIEIPRGGSADATLREQRRRPGLLDLDTTWTPDQGGMHALQLSGVRCAVHRGTCEVVSGANGPLLLWSVPGAERSGDAPGWLTLTQAKRVSPAHPGAAGRRR